MSDSLRINWVLKNANLTGGVRTVRQLAEALERRGHRSTIAHLDGSEPWPSPWRVRVFARRILRQWQLSGREQHHLESSRLPTVSVKGDRVRAEDLPDADVTIATWWETMEWIADWPSSKGRPVYYVQHIELHGGAPERVRATYRRPGLKIAVATWLQRTLADEYAASEVVLVPNGLDSSQFDTPERGRQDRPTVGVMTSKKDWKRTDLAFEAVRRVREQVPDLKLVAFGADPLLPEQRALAPPGLEFHLRPEQSALREVYRACDAWLLPSDLEGFGLPGLEAAACRCPVIATRCGGPEDYVQDGVSGYLVPVGDAAAMAERLIALLRAPESEWRAMSDAAREMASRFRWETSAEILERALLDYVGRGHESSSPVPR